LKKVSLRRAANRSSKNELVRGGSLPSVTRYCLIIVTSYWRRAGIKFEYCGLIVAVAIAHDIARGQMLVAHCPLVAHV
jgi:hypothetical protein